MLLNQFIKKNNERAPFILLAIVILSAIIILLSPGLYFYVIITDIVCYSLFALFFKDLIFLSICCIVITLRLFFTWETIDIEINKSRYYNTFQPIMKYDCLAGLDLINGSIDQNVHCKTLGLSQNDSTMLIAFIKNDKTINHLKRIGCYRIEIGQNFIQFWYADDVIDIMKTKDNKIVYETSPLE